MNIYIKLQSIVDQKGTKAARQRVHKQSNIHVGATTNEQHRG